MVGSGGPVILVGHSLRGKRQITAAGIDDRVGRGWFIISRSPPALLMNNTAHPAHPGHTVPLLPSWGSSSPTSEFVEDVWAASPEGKNQVFLRRTSEQEQPARLGQRKGVPNPNCSTRRPGGTAWKSKPAGNRRGKDHDRSPYLSALRQAHLAPHLLRIEIYSTTSRCSPHRNVFLDVIRSPQRNLFRSRRDSLKARCKS